jgi:hypothetical protein
MTKVNLFNKFGISSECVLDEETLKNCDRLGIKYERLEEKPKPVKPDVLKEK